MGLGHAPQGTPDQGVEGPKTSDKQKHMAADDK